MKIFNAKYLRDSGTATEVEGPAIYVELTPADWSLIQSGKMLQTSADKGQFEGLMVMVGQEDKTDG